ncbi:unnamed protein product [Litomosoides sigmodontis]|uniref:Olfactomedin-like domain-containing protein n=1 Tax=Litomosoides sigmodontis TaxID=42156 RepID=A0A3P6TK07_LITSI|nr:unnamed protein product [Litomosoides sigmodontis]
MISNGIRYRREIRDVEDSNKRESTLYLPIYAQISDKSLKAICEDHRRRRKKQKWKNARNVTNYNKAPRAMNEQDCGLISSISRPHTLAHRLNRIGGIVRHGAYWFQTEYSLGYNVFEFRNLTDLRLSHPSAVHSLDIARFDGTDNAACNGNNFIYYASSTSHIYSYQVDRKRSKSAPIHASKIPIYKFSHSYVDLENDGGNLWILYHSVPDNILKVSLRDCASLAERKSWILQFLDTKTIVNAFIACNRLYTITQNVTSNILNIIYDFGSDELFENIPQIGSWKRYGVPSTVQYDHTTKTINVFDNGVIYSIAVQM